MLFRSLDEDGKVVAEEDESFDDDGVIVVPSAIAPIEGETPLAAPVFLEPKSKGSDASSKSSAPKSTASKSGAAKSGAAKPTATKASPAKPANTTATPSKRAAPAIVTKKDLAARASEPKSNAKPSGRKQSFDDNDPRLF